MTHYFWTRIACHGPRSVHGNFPVRSVEETEWHVRFWRDYAGKFYEHQTKDAPFTVCLRYDPEYEGLVKSFDWPQYVILTTAEVYEWLPANVKPGARITATAVDADDSYSVDFLEYLSSLTLPARMLLIHHRLRQYHVPTGRLSQQVYHERPNLATIYWPKFPGPTEYDAGQKFILRGHDPNPKQRALGVGIGGGEYYGLTGDHGNYPHSPHIATPGCHGLFRITGRNSISAEGVLAWESFVFKPEKQLDPRFVGYGPPPVETP